MNKRIGNIFKGDRVIWMVFFFLCMISIVEVFSASSGLTYKSHNYIGPIIYHTGTIIAGAVVAIVTLNIPCRYFKLMTPFLMVISLVTLLWVLLAGTKIGDAGRWINLFGFTFQPSGSVRTGLTAMPSSGLCGLPCPPASSSVWKTCPPQPCSLLLSS